MVRHPERGVSGRHAIVPGCSVRRTSPYGFGKRTERPVGPMPTIGVGANQHQIPHYRFAAGCSPGLPANRSSDPSWGVLEHLVLRHRTRDARRIGVRLGRPQRHDPPIGRECDRMGILAAEFLRPLPVPCSGRDHEHVTTLRHSIRFRQLSPRPPPDDDRNRDDARNAEKENQVAEESATPRECRCHAD